MEHHTNGSQSLAPISTHVDAALGHEKAREIQNGSGPASRILNSWKDIANYLGRGVRTVQRYESQFGLPVRRPAGKNRSSVIAFAGEIDEWLTHAPRKEDDRQSSRVLLVFEGPGGEPKRKLVVEVVRLSSQSLSSAEEVCELANRLDVDEVLVEMNPADETSARILRAMKGRPARAVLFVSPQVREKLPKLVSPALADLDAAKLLRAVKAGLGEAEAA